MCPEHCTDARHPNADPVLCLLLTGRISSSGRHTANPEYNVRTTAEVTDLMLELILHMTRDIVRLQVCRPIYTYRIGLGLPLDPRE